MEREKKGKRLRKWLIIPAIILVGIALLVILLPHLIPESWLKSKAEEMVQTATSANIEMGRVRWGWFSGVVLKEVSLNLPQAEEPPLLTLSQANLKVKYLPLLKGRVHLGEVQLTGMDLHIERDEEGQFNFTPLLLAARPPKDQPAGRRTSLEAEKPAIKDFRLAHLSISESTLTYQDRLAEKSPYTIDFNVDLEGKAADTYEIKLQTRIKKDEATVGAFKSSFLIQSDKKSLVGKLEIDDLDLALFMSYMSPRVPAARVAGNAQGTLDFKVSPQAWSMSGKIRATPLSGSWGEKAPITLDLPWLEISPTLYSEAAEAPLKIESLQLASPFGQLLLQGELTKDTEHLSLDAVFGVEPDKMYQMIKGLPEPKEIKTTGAVEGQANCTLGDGRWHAKGEFNLNEMALAYAEKLSKEAGALAHIQYDLSGPLPSLQPQGTTLQRARALVGEKSYENWLRTARGSLQAELGRLGVGEAFLETARADAKLSQGLMQMEGTARIFAGETSGQLNLDFNKEPLSFAGNLMASKLQANDILRSLVKRVLTWINFTGLVGLDTKFAGSLHKTRPETLGSIQASGTLTITEGTFKGEDPPAYLSWIFPALNLAAYQFSEAILNFSRAPGDTSIDMKFEGRVIDLYLVGKQDAQGNLNYDLGVDLWQNLPPEERKVRPDVTFARIPVLNFSRRIEKGEVKSQKRYVSPPELVLRLADKGLVEKLPSTVIREEIRKTPRRILQSPEKLAEFLLKQILPAEEKKPEKTE
jgi:hypothetical protein